ncbi:MAG TPA: hypothetical protein VFZ16_03830 [Hyphomicrobiaceae bacterium]|nr:hypothetical protein [Hyphomicrobiaceae bacterium]
MAMSFARWQRLNKEPERYAEEKRNIAEAVIGLLDKRFPKLRDDIEIVDVATPMATPRLTGNGHGYRSPIAALALALFTGRRLSQMLPSMIGPDRPQVSNAASLLGWGAC